MSGENQLNVHLTCSLNLICVCKDLCAVTLDGIYTGSNKTSCTHYLYEAETASTDLVNVLKIAESGISMPACLQASRTVVP